jgi:hypothetical protein
MRDDAVGRTSMRSLRRALLADEGGHQRELVAVIGPLIGCAFIGTGIEDAR